MRPASCDILCRRLCTHWHSLLISAYARDDSRHDQRSEYKRMVLCLPPILSIFPREFIFCTSHIVTIKAVLENGGNSTMISQPYFSKLFWASASLKCVFNHREVPKRPHGQLTLYHPVCSSWVLVLGVFKSLGYENHVETLTTCPPTFGEERLAAPDHHFLPIRFRPLWIHLCHALDSGKSVTGIKAAWWGNRGLRTRKLVLYPLNTSLYRVLSKPDLSLQMSFFSFQN